MNRKTIEMWDVPTGNYYVNMSDRTICKVDETDVVYSTENIGNTLFDFLIQLPMNMNGDLVKIYNDGRLISSCLLKEE